MSIAKDPKDMDAAELEQHIADLEADVEGTEEERDFTLKQTNMHIMAGAAEKFQARLDSIKERIAEAQALLAAKKG
jgi:hypothetical protein